MSSSIDSFLINGNLEAPLSLKHTFANNECNRGFWQIAIRSVAVFPKVNLSDIVVLKCNIVVSSKVSASYNKEVYNAPLALINLQVKKNETFAQELNLVWFDCNHPNPDKTLLIEFNAPDGSLYKPDCEVHCLILMRKK